MVARLELLKSKAKANEEFSTNMTSNGQDAELGTFEASPLQQITLDIEGLPRDRDGIDVVRTVEV